MLLGKTLLRPATDATTDKKKSCNANSPARYKAREEERDAEGKKYRPRRACRHFYWLCLPLFRSAIIHHKSPSDQVNNCEHDDPYCIHEMPIEGDHTKAFALSRVHPTAQRKDEDRSKEKQSNHNVGGVESYQGVERCAKQVRADGEPVLIDQLLQFNRCVCQEDCCTRDCGAEPNGKASHRVVFDSLLRAPDHK